MLPAQTDTLADHGINIPPGASGQVRATCPQCSHDRRKPADRCLSINADESVWLCFNCGWAGGLGGREYNSVPPTKKQAAQKARIEAEKKRIAVAKMSGSWASHSRTRRLNQLAVTLSSEDSERLGIYSSQIRFVFIQISDTGKTASWLASHLVLLQRSSIDTAILEPYIESIWKRGAQKLPGRTQKNR